MKTNYRAVLLAVVIITGLFATGFSMNAAKSVKVTVGAFDKLAKKSLPYVQTEVYRLADTTLTDIRAAYMVPGGVMLDLPQGAAYLLRLIPYYKYYDDNGVMKSDVDPNLEEVTLEVDLREFKGSSMELPAVYFPRKIRKELSEVTVKASRILFYHKGDTLVYNADAFVLAEGTMLDGLIEQLPGVKIDSHGVITCNGRKVDNLLLNGKDIFNGNRELMLENIGAYTVKNIAMYEKSGGLSELVGEKLAGDTQYVMDVRLKRHYQNGWIVNTDAGYGTENRYLGRLFGMWYSDNVSVTAYGNFNNLTDERKPGREDKAWTPVGGTSGDVARQSGGLTYNASGSENKWMMLGGVDVEHVKDDSRQDITSTLYVPSGDIFNYSWNRSVFKKFSFSTNHWLIFKFVKGLRVDFIPEFRYSSTNQATDFMEAAFSEDMGEITREDVAGLYNSAEAYRTNVIDRYIRERASKGKNYDGSLAARVIKNLNIGGGSNWLDINLKGQATGHKDNDTERFVVNNGADPVPTSSDSRYTDNSPDRTLKANANMAFGQLLGSHRIELTFYADYSHLHHKNASGVYHLDAPDDIPSGLLPTFGEYLPTFDASLSHRSHTVENGYKVGGKMMHTIAFNIPGTNCHFSVDVQDLSATLLSRKYDFFNAGNIEKIDRTSLLYNISTDFRLSKDNRSKIFSLGLSSKTLKAPLTEMVDLPVTDPMNVYRGNPDLDNSKSHRANLRMEFSKRQRRNIINLSVSAITDAIARGYVYDTSSGVRTFRSYNVNGNWDGGASYEFFMPFGPGRRFDFTTRTGGVWRSSVDMLGSTSYDNGLPMRNRVNTLTFDESVKINFQTGRHRLTAHADARVNRYFGSDAGFERFTSWTCNYGASAVLNLPYNWGFSSDLTLYTRRGFTDSRLNTTDLVWNARLTKSVLKGALVFIVDGYDILRQLSNVSYTVNAQARTEVVSNVIPAYVLMHVQFRFNKQPRKR